MAENSDGRRPAKKDGEGGYRNPPKKNQFKKGEPSPNPFGCRGKPKGDVSAVAIGFLDEMIPILENGKRVKMTRDEVINHRLFAAAGKGDVKASKRLDERIEMRRRREEERLYLQSVARAAHAQDASADEAIIFKALARRAKNGGAIGKVEEPDE